MAVGNRSNDSAKSVLRSSPRFAMRRGLVSGLEGTMEFMDSPSTTRSGRILRTPATDGDSASVNRSRKRTKTSCFDDDIVKEEPEGEVMIEGEGSEVKSQIVVVGDRDKAPTMAGDAGSTVFEEPVFASLCKDEEAVVEVERSMEKSTNKNLELKMSKKVSLMKLPLTVNDLLASGLLEGLPVMCVYRSNKDGLRGTIMESGILCSCSSCRGSKVVSAFDFLLHAGCSHKYLTKYICFENGKSFSEILYACKRAPVDMLESTIVELFQPSTIVKPELVHPALEANQSQQNAVNESPVTEANCGRSPVVQLKSQPFDNASMQLSFEKNGHSRLTKKDLRLHKLIFMSDVLPDGTELAYYGRGKRLLDGYKKGNSIFCRCCCTEVSPSQFEVHAGWASRRKPYHYIYTSNGVSLHELSVSLSKDLNFSVSESDDLCSVCADGGELVLCDTCPRAFHKECVGLLDVPCGDWHCKYCKTMFESQRAVAYNANALAAGRVLGDDPVEQISKRCIRVVNTLEPGVSACVLCRGHDFSKSGFGPRTVVLCDQCEKDYHVGCLKDHEMADLKELPEGKWFCCQDCKDIHISLRNMISRGPEAIPTSRLDSIRHKNSGGNSNDILDFDVSWRVLSGKSACSDSKLLLSQAVDIFHTCFSPIVDPTTGRDLIPSMVYGWNIREQEFGGMYCAILMVNSSVVSAGILRIFGREVAELPLVATCRENQGKGYFQSLFACIERFLGFLSVKNLVLPAAEEAESIWTQKFGFKKIDEDELCKYSDLHTMSFKGTSMLHKLVPRCEVVRKQRLFDEEIVL